MSESDEWATVETVADEEIGDNALNGQGPDGIQFSVLETSR